MTDKKYVPKSETVTYAVAALGQGLIYSCMSSYITDFYMNVLALAPMFVTLLMLLARVWDAVNDPMMGMIVDRHTTKWGRLKPYPVLTALPIAVFTILMFTKNIFSFDLAQKEAVYDSMGRVVDQRSPVGVLVVVAVIYVLWGMIYTAGDVPFWGLPNLMTPNQKERAKIVSYGRTWGGVGSAFTVALPIILGFTALAARDDFNDIKYFIMAVVMTAIGIPLYVLSSFNTKERIAVPNAARKDPSEPSTLSRIFKCKPLMMVVLGGILSFGRYMLQAAAPHVARYAGFYIGIDPLNATAEQLNKNMSTVQTVIQICTAIGMFGAMLILPALYEKFEYRTLMIGSCLGGFGAGVIAFLIGVFTRNLFICMPFFLIMAIPLGVINVVSGIMVSDCLDFMEWQTGYRDNGLGSACQSFVNKLGNAFATVAIILMYEIIHLDVNSLNASGNAVLAAAQSLQPAQHNAMFALVTLVPGLSLMLTAIPLFFYDYIGEKKRTVSEQLGEKRKERGVEISD